jgi:hypothetical protein
MHAPADPDRPTPIAALTEELVRVGAALSLVIDHMARHARSAPPGSDPVDVVLERVLHDVLAPALEDRPDAMLRDAVGVVTAAREAIGRDVFLVDVDDLGARPARRRRGGRRPR